MGRLVWKIWTSIYLCSFQFSLEVTSFFLWKTVLDKNNSFSFSDVNVAVRKIANLLKPDKEILQNGDHMVIKTLSTFRNYIMEFDVGKEFEEDLSGVDDRKCMVRSGAVTMDKKEYWDCGAFHRTHLLTILGLFLKLFLYFSVCQEVPTVLSMPLH